MADTAVANTTAQLSGKTLLTAEGAWTITGIQTHSVAPVVNAGIKFPATQVADAGVNVLDDYEEGSWTPSLGGITSESGQVYTTQVGRYVKIGRLVHAQGRIVLSTLGTITGGVTIKGLPFTAVNVTDGYSTLTIGYHTALTTAVVWLGGFVVPNTTRADIYMKTAAATGTVGTAQADYANTSEITFSMSYLSVD